jgi:hypothetical protein
VGEPTPPYRRPAIWLMCDHRVESPYHGRGSVFLDDNLIYPKGHYPSPTGLRYGSQVLRFRQLFAVPANEPKAAELQAAEELAISGDLGGEHASLEIRQNGGRGA